MIGNVATAYAITYIFGLAGLIAIIKLLPNLLGIDLPREAKALEARDGEVVWNVSARSTGSPMKRSQGAGKQLEAEYWDGSSVVRVRRDGEVIELGPDGHLHLGDELYILAPVEFFTHFAAAVGEEIAPRSAPKNTPRPQRSWS